MSDQEKQPSEEELQAFVDDRLDPARRDEVESWLAGNADAA
ncbi:MAG: anti-sigma factor, partial [Alphaproteobacteria bacterium]|nr:anti-sigma factor [Alphaproteobacteria bacterium]